MTGPDPFAPLDPFDPLALGVEEEVLAGLVARLAEADGPADEAGVWPAALWQALVEAGASRWPIPEEFGGLGLDRPSMVLRYVLVAEGSLTAAFILTQQDAAIRRLVAAAGTHDRARDWLWQIADGRAFSTVGLSQLTTSLRRGPQALRASEIGEGAYRLDGAMPWVSAADRADVIVTGGVLDDGRQVLIALPGDRAGVSIGEPMPLAALQASCTTEVVCEGVEVRPEEVLFGPDPDVLKLASGGGGAGGLETSALAVGQSRAALRALRQLSFQRDELTEPAEALEAAWQGVTSALLAAAEGRPDAPDPAEIRRRSHDLALRTSQAYLTARQGTGFLRPEPAQRYARQALFFLVWSCPGPVAQAALRDFAGLCPDF
ncbi:acyl-CoA dehydrogenase [soil metagenome]